MDPNTASKRELMSLPGIGPNLAERIIQKRRAHKFEKVEDLLLVSGIGLRKLELIRPYIEIESVGYNTPEPAGTEDFLIRLAPTPPREPKCPYDHSLFLPTDDIVECSSCHTYHHADCWAENQGCACYGCGSTECSTIAQTLSDLIISQSTYQPALDITLDIDSPRIQTLQPQDDNQEENTTLDVEIPEEAELLRRDQASQPETVSRHTRLWLSEFLKFFVLCLSVLTFAAIFFVPTPLQVPLVIFLVIIIIVVVAIWTLREFW